MLYAGSTLNYRFTKRSGQNVLNSAPADRYTDWAKRIYFVGNNSAIPVGYAMNGYELALHNGDLGATGNRIVGYGNVDAALTAIADLVASLAGLGTVSSASVAGGININANLAGLGTVSSAASSGIGHLAAIVRIGANPSADDIAQAILNAAATSYDMPGTIGEKINDAGSAGNPWTDTTTYPDGTKGALLKQAADDAELAAIK